jgi:hypothetical protein
MNDLALALRLLSKQRTLALSVVATLALGIGSTVLMFSIVNGVLLQPLPFPGAGQLVSVGESSPGWKDNPVGTYTYRVWRERSRSFEHLAVMHRTERSIEGRGDPLIVEAAHVSASFFDAIDIQPAVGRTFDRGAPENAIVLSDHLWRRLGADPGLLGTTLRIVDRPFVVVGVMPPVTVSGPFIGLADYWTWSGSDPMRQASDEEVRPSSFRGRSAIRIVLGATRSTIVRLVMRDSLLMVVMGSAAGITGGLLASRLMHSLLFGVSPADGISFAAATLILTAVSGIASYLPARRAAAVDPAALLQN